jgi:acetolactate synthase-1/2/3 large subunit
MGGYGEYVEKPDDIRGALERAFASSKPACVNVSLDPKGLVKTAPNMAYML